MKSSGFALIWVVIAVFGAATVLGVGVAKRQEEIQVTAPSAPSTPSTLTETPDVQPAVPQTDQDDLDLQREAYYQQQQQQPDIMANPLSPETQQYCTASPGDPSCGIVKEIYGDTLQQMYGNVFGQPEPSQQYINPMANPDINPMANPKINPLANPDINPLANPEINPMYIPGQYTPGSLPGVPNIPGFPSGLPDAGGWPARGGFGGGGFGGWGR